MVGQFLDELSSWAPEIVDSLNETERSKVVTAIAKVFVTLVSGLDAIRPNRDQWERGIVVEAPPVLPHELAAMKMRDFNDLRNRYMPRLRSFFSESDIEQIGDEFAALKRVLMEKMLRQRHQASTSKEPGKNVGTALEC